MTSQYSRWPDASGPEGRRIFEQVLSLLDETVLTIKEGPVAPEVDQLRIREWLQGLTFEGPQEPRTFMRQLLEHFALGSVHTIHPRYFGLYNPAPLVWGEIADLVAARLNPQLATWSHSPVAVEVEQHALRFIARRIGFADAAAFFTSGGEEANRCGVQLALVRKFPHYTDEGLRSLAGQPILYVSAQSHLAWIKIASMLGLGREAVRLVPVNAGFQIDVQALVEMIGLDRSAGRLPFFIGATAGTTSAGIIDPLPELAAVAQQEGLHLHVDAAWAGAVLLSRRWRHLLAGIEHADSVTIDAHKWLSQPMGTGMFFSRDLSAPEAAFGVSTGYMPARVEGTVDYYVTSPTWSRRWVGLRLFLSLTMGGAASFEAQIDHDVRLGKGLRDLLEANGWHCLNNTELPVLCFTDASQQRNAEWHRQVAAHVVASGKAWISTVALHRQPALRACVTNWQSENSDIEALVAALEEARCK